MEPTSTELPFRLHPSAHEEWIACAKKFEFSTVHRVKPSHLHPAGVSGTAVHRTIALIHKEAIWDGDENLLMAAYAEGFHHAVHNPIREEDRGVPILWGEYRDETTAMPMFARDALGMLRGYSLDPRNRNAEVVLADATFRATFGGFRWQGTLDQARKTEHGIELFDFKTSREPLGDVPRGMWPQGLSYVLGMRHGTFRPVLAGDDDPWEPVDLDAVAVNWVQLKEYIPYKKGGTRKDGSKYLAGDARGPVFYRTPVTPAMLNSHLHELHIFATRVLGGEFERRPSNRTCLYECRFARQCLAEFGMDVGGINPTATDYEEE